MASFAFLTSASLTRNRTHFSSSCSSQWSLICSRRTRTYLQRGTSVLTACSADHDGHEKHEAVSKPGTPNLHTEGLKIKAEETSHDVDHDGVTGGSGKGGGNDGNHSDDSKDGDEDWNDTKGAAREISRRLKDRLDQIGRKLLVDIKAFIHFVPAQVTVAIISVVSTLSGARYKRKLDAENERKKRIEEENKRREQLQDELHALFQNFTGPLLRSSAKLADRLYTLVNSPHDAFESDLDPLYTAYVIGRYFAVIEMLKLESPNLAFGFPAADRIFLNIIGRIQGVWAANDYTLARLQRAERSLHSAKNDTILKGGLLQISPYAQSVCGDLMLRVRWNRLAAESNKVDEDGVRGGVKAMISFLEFSELMKRRSAMSEWFTPIVKDIKTINAKRSSRKSMKEIIGARIYVLQSALCDLVEFLDPSPGCRFVPRYRRNRLRLSEYDTVEVQRTPESLLTIYRQLQNIRDQNVEKGKYARYKTPLEVYVKGPYRKYYDYFDSGENGDCPYSQRVLIVLEEMRIPYKKVTIYPERKPQWFPLLNAEGEVPVVAHEGLLIEDSRQIVAYLVDKFPNKATRIATSDGLHLTAGTAEFTKFYDEFKSWLAGARGSTVKKVDAELCKLNGTIARVQEKQKGPFFGGQKFNRIDTAVAPFLHHVSVAGPRLRELKVTERYPALRTYLEACFEVPSFKKTKSSEESIVKGYSTLVKEGPKQGVRLPDLIE